MYVTFSHCVHRRVLFSVCSRPILFSFLITSFFVFIYVLVIKCFLPKSTDEKLTRWLSCNVRLHFVLFLCFNVTSEVCPCDRHFCCVWCACVRLNTEAWALLKCSPHHISSLSSPFTFSGAATRSESHISSSALMFTLSFKCGRGEHAKGPPHRCGRLHCGPPSAVCGGPRGSVCCGSVLLRLPTRHHRLGLHAGPCCVTRCK